MQHACASLLSMGSTVTLLIDTILDFLVQLSDVVVNE